MSDIIKLSCGCEATQGVGFTRTCHAHKTWKDNEVAAETEACAKIADEHGAKDPPSNDTGPYYLWAADDIASAIRARKGNQA